MVYLDDFYSGFDSPDDDFDGPHGGDAEHEFYQGRALANEYIALLDKMGGDYLDGSKRITGDDLRRSHEELAARDRFRRLSGMLAYDTPCVSRGTNGYGRPYAKWPAFSGGVVSMALLDDGQISVVHYDEHDVRVDESTYRPDEEALAYVDAQTMINGQAPD